MECSVCGKFYSVTHDCAGVSTSVSAREAASIPKDEGFDQSEIMYQ